MSKHILIEGTVTMPDGTKAQYLIRLGEEDEGYQQWGANPSELGRTQPVVEALYEGVRDSFDLGDLTGEGE